MSSYKAVFRAFPGKWCLYKFFRDLFSIFGTCLARLASAQESLCLSALHHRPLRSGPRNHWEGLLIGDWNGIIFVQFSRCKRVLNKQLVGSANPLTYQKLAQDKSYYIKWNCANKVFIMQENGFVVGSDSSLSIACAAIATLWENLVMYIRILGVPILIIYILLAHQQETISRREE